MTPRLRENGQGLSSCPRQGRYCRDMQTAPTCSQSMPLPANCIPHSSLVCSLNDGEEASHHGTRETDRNSKAEPQRGYVDAQVTTQPHLGLRSVRPGLSPPTPPPRSRLALYTEGPTIQAPRELRWAYPRRPCMKTEGGCIELNVEREGCRSKPWSSPPVAR